MNNPIPSIAYTHQDDIDHQPLVSPNILTQDEVQDNPKIPNMNDNQPNTNHNVATNPNETTVDNLSNPNRGGRPLGSTYVEDATNRAISEVAKNEITVAYATEYKHRLNKKNDKTNDI